MSSQSRDLASRMADAAVALIESLDVPQRATMCRPFDDTEERLRFFYTPTDHGSLPISAMRAGQVVTVSSSTRARTPSSAARSLRAWRSSADACARS